MGEPLKPARPITRQLERFAAETGVIEEWLAMPAAATLPITVVSSIFRMNVIVQAGTRMVEPIGHPGRNAGDQRRVPVRPVGSTGGEGRRRLNGRVGRNVWTL